MKGKIITSLGVFMSVLGLTQGEKNDCFDFYSNDKILYVIGENHHRVNHDVQISLINYILDCTFIDNIILEVPVEMGEIFNQFVLGKSTFKEVEKCFPFLIKQAIPNITAILFFIRECNETNISISREINIRGVDMLSFGRFRINKKYIKFLYPELKLIKSQFLKKTLYRPGFHLRKSELIQFQKEFVEEIRENENEYLRCLDTKFNSFKENVNQLSLYSASYLEFFTKREELMKLNLFSILDTTKKSIMICGAYHAFKSPNTKLATNESFTSITAAASQKYPNMIYSIIQHYYERFEILPEVVNFLNGKVKELFPSLNNRVECVKNSDILVVKEFEKEFDLIVVSR